MSRKLVVPSEITGDGPADLSASALTNATSTGDAGSRADHFTGTSLAAAWTQIGTAPSTTATVKYSVLSLTPGAGGGQHLRAFTPSGAFRVECRIIGGYSSNGFGLLVRNAGSNDTTGTDGVLAWIDGTFTGLVAYTIDSGSFNTAGSTVLYPERVWAYLAVERNGSNQWTWQISQDRVTWQTAASAVSKTFTVAQLGFRYTGTARPIAIDLIDVVS